MSTYAVQYTYAENSTESRDIHRPEHREHLSELHDQGVVRASGPLTDPDGALVIVDAESAQGAIDALAGDPFQREGLVADVTARSWTVVVGSVV